MRNHEKHKYANSSRAGKITHLRIWTKLHKKWFGNWTPVLPLTPEKIRAVASQMRQRRYRSFQNYMSTLRRWHVKKGYAWDQALSLEATDSTRSCKRGIGPAKQAATFSGGLEAVVAAEVPNTVPLVAGGPVGMISLVVIAVFFLLREIEAALM